MNEGRSNWLTNPDWYMVILTALILAATIITVVVFYKQFGEMAKQTRILDEQAQQAAKDADDASRSVQKELSILNQQVRATQQGAEAIQRQMRQDQRAWMEISSPPVKTVTVGEPITVPVTVVNRGKTPATHVSIDAVVKQVRNGQVPKFRYEGEPREYSVAGMLQPGVQQIIHAKTYDHPPGGRKKHGCCSVLHPITATEYEELNKGRAFFTTYVRIRYQDIFGRKHVARYCMFSGVGPQGTVYSAKECAEYNGVDDN